EEGEAEKSGDREEDFGPEEIVPRDCEARQPAGEAREQQAGRFRRRSMQIEDLARSRAAVARLDEHRVGGEEAGEEDDVGEDEDPEPVAHHDALGRRSAGSVAGVLRHARAGRAVADVIGVASGAQRGAGGAHSRGSRCASVSRRNCRCCSAALRAARLARSRRATSSAGIRISSWSRQANTTNVAYAPASPSRTSHQMCQMSAKPVTTAKKAVTNPVGLLRGMWMGSYCGSGRVSWPSSRARAFMSQ